LLEAERSASLSFDVRLDVERGHDDGGQRSVSGAQPLANVTPICHTTMTVNFDLNYIAAPMVNQSDTPFRALVHNHGATLTYTEMLRPARLLSDPDYLAFHRRALELGRSSSTGPVIVQVCGNDQEAIVRGAKTVVDLCDGIGM
jgi:Dihydrouridine synthase (Dus)